MSLLTTLFPQGKGRACHGDEEPEVDAAILVNLTWQAGDAVEVSGTAAPRTRKYEFFMSDVDELVIEIMNRTGLNPKFFTGMVGPGGREALRYQNSHASAWLS